MSVLITTEDAVNLPLVSMYLTASIASAIRDTPVMVLPAQVRHSFCRRQTFIIIVRDNISRQLQYSEFDRRICILHFNTLTY